MDTALRNHGSHHLRRQAGGYAITNCQFLGDPVNMVLHDPRDRTIHSALDTGHFGAKLHRSTGPWLEHRVVLGLREWRRILATGVRAPAAGLLRAICLRPRASAPL